MFFNQLTNWNCNLQQFTTFVSILFQYLIPQLQTNCYFSHYRNTKYVIDFITKYKCPWLLSSTTWGKIYSLLFQSFLITTSIITLFELFLYLTDKTWIKYQKLVFIFSSFISWINLNLSLSVVPFYYFLFAFSVNLNLPLLLFISKFVLKGGCFFSDLICSMIITIRYQPMWEEELEKKYSHRRKLCAKMMKKTFIVILHLKVVSEKWRLFVCDNKSDLFYFVLKWSWLKKSDVILLFLMNCEFVFFFFLSNIFLFFWKENLKYDVKIFN